jgi:hypothetical protein
MIFEFFLMTAEDAEGENKSAMIEVEILCVLRVSAVNPLFPFLVLAWLYFPTDDV